MSISMRYLFDEMNAECLGDPGLDTLGKLHRLKSKRPVSMRALAGRHEKSFRFLWLNTYLLPNIKLHISGVCDEVVNEGAPACFRRAAEIGNGSPGDCVALCEVFTDHDKAELLGAKDNPPAVSGPGSGSFTIDTTAATSMLASLVGIPFLPSSVEIQTINSGLLTILPKDYALLEHSTERFNHQGDPTRDADAWSNKGVLRVVVETGFNTKFEIYTTHLIYGGGLRDRDKAASFEVQKQQINQLVSFVQRSHPADSRNFIIVAGDFNIDAAESDYDYLRQQMEDVLGLEDVWVRHAQERYQASLGRTNDPAACLGDMIADDATGKAVDDNGRIDYIFIQKPHDKHDITVDVKRPRRIRFPRSDSWPDYDKIQFFSDHCGIKMDLFFAGKT